MGVTKTEIKDETLLALHNAGHSSRQIESIIGSLDHSTICKRLKHLSPRNSTHIFRELKADILAEKQRKLLMSADKLTPKEQRDIAVAFGVYHDKEERLRGLNPEDKPLIIINQRIIGNAPVDHCIDITQDGNTYKDKPGNE